MHVLFVSPEVAPFSSSGELGEFSGTLPAALREIGIHVTVITPFYRGIAPEQFSLARRIRTLEIPVGSQRKKIGLLDGKFINSDVSVLFIDHPKSFDRESYYGDADGPYPDNHRRFYLLCRAALTVAEEFGLAPDLIHANGWQTGLLPLLLRQGVAPSLQDCNVVFTVHDPTTGNDFDPKILDELDIGHDLFHPDGIEFHGRVSLTKAGIVASHQITTLSPTYARELQTEPYGAGLHGLFAAQKDRLSGILAGIDHISWNPANDTRIPASFGPEDLSGKATCKAALQEELGFKVRAGLPLIVLRGPVKSADELEIVLNAVKQLSTTPFQLAFIGPFAAGEDQILRALEEEMPETIAYQPEPDAESTRRAVAGADAVLIPARYEPGGLLQLKAMRYGALPLVRHVGGLKDTVVDVDVKSGTGTGICFLEHSSEALISSIHRLLSLYGDAESWQMIVGNAMSQVFSPTQAAQRYRAVYSF